MTRACVAAVMVWCGVAAAGNPPPIGATAKLDHTVAVVDRVPIWQSELDEIYARNDVKKPTPEQAKIALDALIDEAIIQHAAEALHLTVGEAEVDAAVAEIQKQNGLDAAGLDKALAQQHFTRAQYRQEIVRQLQARQLYQLQLAPHIAVSEDEIKAAFAELKLHNSALTLDAATHETLRAHVWGDKLDAAQKAWMEHARATAHIERRP